MDKIRKKTIQHIWNILYICGQDLYFTFAYKLVVQLVQK